MSKTTIDPALDDLPEPDLTDPDNPEWTAEDFARAERPESLPPEVLAAFPNTKVRGRPRSEAPKAHVSLRLAPDVLAFYRAKGKGWQVEVEAALRRGMTD